MFLWKLGFIYVFQVEKVLAQMIRILLKVSMFKGFGHYINEARSVGAMVII
jgi:predicted nucleic acid-binding Zn ribbon protein